MASGLVFPRESKNFKLSKWETSLCFDSIFKFVWLFATVFLLSQVGLSKNLISLQSQNFPGIFLREESQKICHMPYMY